MAHFAEIDENGIVLRVIVAEPEYIETGRLGDPAKWIQTSYNTEGGVHKQGGVSLRKNFAGPGWKYDAVRDAFIPPKPYASWILDEQKCQWKAPKARASEKKPWFWNEEKQDWEVNGA